jgi:tRNA/tmRNA/rRNA uracil-C5-methylase (TrmA/RlmC/RlmD family)
MADDTFVLTLEKPVAGGRSLARLDGRVVLVSGGIPGERVRVAMERSGKGVAFARVIDVEEASPDRVVPVPDPQCGGLAFAHVAYDRQLALKRAIVEDALGRIGRLRDLPTIGTVGSPAREWRLRARLHAHGTHVGFYREGTHSLCDPASSGQLAPGLLELAQDTMTRVRPELARSVEAVVVSQTVRGDQQAVHLELSRPLPRHGDIWLGPPSADCTGVSAGLVTSRHLGVLHGHPWLRESMPALGVSGAPEDAGLIRHAAAFFQGNRALLPHLVGHVLAAVPADTPVVDLYAGVGLFGIAAAAAGTSAVTAVEGDAVSAEDLVANALPYGDRVRAVRGDVETFAREEATRLAGSCVILDPPRTGLSPVVSAAIAAAALRRVIYVSCDPATLARDLQVLAGAGLHVEALTVFDLFPLTAHVETVVTLTNDV